MHFGIPAQMVQYQKALFSCLQFEKAQFGNLTKYPQKKKISRFEIAEVFFSPKTLNQTGTNTPNFNTLQFLREMELANFLTSQSVQLNEHELLNLPLEVLHVGK